VTIQITADEIAEDNQTFLVSGSSNNSSVTVGDALTVTIIDDDTATVTISDNSTTEQGNNNNSTVTVALQLDKAVEGGFSVLVSTGEPTDNASSANDYDSISQQQIDFNGTIGETKTLPITIKGDNRGEGSETFTVKIDSLVNTNASVSTSDIGTVTISDPP
jgi:hypothetical protein